MPLYEWKYVKLNADLLRIHLKTHSEKCQINVTYQQYEGTFAHTGGDRYPGSFLLGSVYWQTVTVCQLEIIGRSCKKYLWALAHCCNLLNSVVMVALLCRASGVCQQEEIGKSFTYFANGLPITSNWQTVTVCQ